jgi:uncharacterized integral membrane protein (TIGR00697 family)
MSKPVPAFKHLGTVTAFFSVILVTSNVASSAKIADLGFSVLGVRMIFDGGTLLFPLSYVFADILTEVYGFILSRRVIWTGFACLALSSLCFFLLRLLPGESTWEISAGQNAYEAILGGMSTGGIALASLAGYLAGEFSNSVILSRLKVLLRGRFLWVRTIGSTLVGELLDSLVFVSIATLAGVFGRESFASLVFTNYAVKCVLEAVLTPFTYRLCAFLKKAENVDTYDEGIRYTPF